MIRAMIENGTIKPLEPLPAEWVEGREVVVKALPADASETTDEAYDELLRRLTDLYDSDDHARLEAALAEADRIAKEQMRREMDLS